MGLGDDLLGLLVSSLDDTGALGLGVLTGLENDVGSLTTGVGDDRVGLSALGDSLLLGLLGLVEALLDLLAALLHGFHDARQGDLGQHDPDNQEGDKRRDELRHLRDEDVRTGSAVLSERGSRHEQRGRGRGECDRALLG